MHVHSQCLEFDTQDTGPAYIRMRLTLARGPLDPLLSQPYSISRRAGPLTLEQARSHASFQLSRVSCEHACNLNTRQPVRAKTREKLKRGVAANGSPSSQG